MSKLYIGIDNGVTGGMCAISGPHSKVISFKRMPVKVSRAKEVNVRGFKDWVIAVTGDQLEGVKFLLEEPGGSKSAAAAKSMAGSFHALRGFFETKGLSWERITSAAWQKVMLPGCKKGQTKARALARSSELWPDENFIPDGCKTPHDGVIDAALIAEYGRRAKL